MSANHILQIFLSAENFPEWEMGLYIVFIVLKISILGLKCSFRFQKILCSCKRERYQKIRIMTIRNAMGLSYQSCNFICVKSPLLTSKPSVCPLNTHTPEIELLLSSPNMIIDPNATLRKPSILCNIPPTRLQDMKILLSSSAYLYSQNQIEQFSLSKCFQKYGMASVIVSLLEYSRLNASKSNVL